jgi:hypothetical protein
MLRYIKGTMDFFLTVQMNDEVHEQPWLITFCDASWARQSDRKSTSGVVCFLDGMIMFQLGRTQGPIAKSSCEAELAALDLDGSESLLVRTMLEELGFTAEVHLRTDATSVEAILRRHGPGRMKHVEIRQLWLQSQIELGKVNIERVDGLSNVADIFTKPLAQVRFEFLRRKLGLGSLKAIYDIVAEHKPEVEVTP